MENETEELTDVERRRKEYEELKAQNDSVEEELLRREQLKARIALGGKTSAGDKAALTPEEELNKEAQDLANEISGAFI